MRGPLGGALVEPEVLRGTGVTKLKCSMISLWMLSGVTTWKNSCAAMSVTRPTSR